MFSFSASQRMPNYLAKGCAVPVADTYLFISHSA